MARSVGAVIADGGIMRCVYVGYNDCIEVYIYGMEKRRHVGISKKADSVCI